MKICQSCAMPLEKDPNGGGTNADGTKSIKFCSYCYREGHFSDDCSDVKDFQRHCRKIMKDNGMNPFMAWVFTRGYSRLERWHKK